MFGHINAKSQSRFVAEVGWRWREAFSNTTTSEMPVFVTKSWHHPEALHSTKPSPPTSPGVKEKQVKAWSWV